MIQGWASSASARLYPGRRMKSWEKVLEVSWKDLAGQVFPSVTTIAANEIIDCFTYASSSSAGSCPRYQTQPDCEIDHGRTAKSGNIVSKNRCDGRRRGVSDLQLRCRSTMEHDRPC